jgi:hypothetical protein
VGDVENEAKTIDKKPGIEPGFSQEAFSMRHGVYQIGEV